MQYKFNKITKFTKLPYDTPIYLGYKTFNKNIIGNDIKFKYVNNNVGYGILINIGYVDTKYEFNYRECILKKRFFGLLKPKVLYLHGYVCLKTGKPFAFKYEEDSELFPYTHYCEMD